MATLVPRTPRALLTWVMWLRLRPGSYVEDPGPPRLLSKGSLASLAPPETGRGHALLRARSQRVTGWAETDKSAAGTAAGLQLPKSWLGLLLTTTHWVGGSQDMC